MRYHQNWHAGRYDPQDEKEYPRFPAEVPGNVQYDYARSIGLDLYYADHVTKLQETEGYYWIYETALQFSAEAEEQVWFVAEGIDYIFDILLNGAVLHRQEGMYTPAELNLTGKAKPGDLLQVVIHPHPARPLHAGEQPQAAADESCKPPVCYGWDWNPRLLISGIWKPCYIETRKADFIRNAEPFYTLNEARTEAEVWFETDCSAPVTYTLRDPGGKQIYRGREPRFRVKDVQLWWCNGQGAPALYEWEAATQSDCKRGVIGFRTVRLVHNEGAVIQQSGVPKSRYAAAVTLELNGRKIFIQGTNWVNNELFFGRVTAELNREQVALAQEAHMNLLRVWGGASLCQNSFYEACDRAGMLVWQEFPLACNNYKGTPAYLCTLEREGAAMIHLLRRHPCLILWCGGNELFNAWSGMDDQSKALRLLNKLCYELDEDRPFFPASPMPGMAHGGYLFYDPVLKKDSFQFFQQGWQTAYAEFGVPAMAAEEELRKIIPENELFPPRATPAWIAHSGFEAHGHERWCCPDIIRHYFGEPQSLAEMVEYSQWMQAAGYREIFEEARRQWPHCSMAVNWCWQEPWINAANNSVLSYPSVKKSSYFTIKDALRPVLASARVPRFDWRGGDMFTAELWLLNQSQKPVREVICATLIVGGARFPLLRWETEECPAGQNLRGPTARMVLPEHSDGIEILLELETEQSERRSVYRFLRTGDRLPYLHGFH